MLEIVGINVDFTFGFGLMLLKKVECFGTGGECSVCRLVCRWVCCAPMRIKPNGWGNCQSPDYKP